MMRLEHWYFFRYGIDPKDSIIGQVYNDPTREDGTRILTSMVDHVKDGLAYTQHNVYELGHSINPIIPESLIKQ